MMAPIAINLDILQGDRESYLGSLLPHIVHLKDDLTNPDNYQKFAVTYPLSITVQHFIITIFYYVENLIVLCSKKTFKKHDANNRYPV